MRASELEGMTALAFRLADAAAAVTLPLFRADGLQTDDKTAAGAGFDPVTAADRGAETAMRRILSAECPEDAIVGEEEAAREGSSGRSWVLDPIDGTRAFISGLPVWGTLIALDDGTTGRIGLIDQPYIGERFVGLLPADAAPSARLLRGAVQRTLRTRACGDLAEATLFTTFPEIGSAEERRAFEAVRDRARLTRYGCDCYAYALLAMGQIDLVIEAGLAPYDIAAPAALVRAAGGVVTDWNGGDARWGGRVLAAGDARVHAAARAILRDHV